MTEPKMTRAEFDALLVRWDSLKKQIAEKTAEEMKMRKQIAHSGFASDDEGTNRFDLGNGWGLKSVIGYNYNLDKDKKKIIDIMDQMPEFISDKLFNWKVEISVKEYKLLDPAYKSIVNRVLTITEAAPKLDIEPPKVKNNANFH